MEVENAFEYFNLPTNTSEKEFKQVFHKMMISYHPDNNDYKLEKAQEISMYGTILINEYKRRKNNKTEDYDDLLSDVSNSFLIFRIKYLIENIETNKDDKFMFILLFIDLQNLILENHKYIKKYHKEVLLYFYEYEELLYSKFNITDSSNVNKKIVDYLYKEIIRDSDGYNSELLLKHVMNYSIICTKFGLEEEKKEIINKMDRLIEKCKKKKTDKENNSLSELDIINIYNLFATDNTNMIKATYCYYVISRLIKIIDIQGMKDIDKKINYLFNRLCKYYELDSLDIMDSKVQDIIIKKLLKEYNCTSIKSRFTNKAYNDSRILLYLLSNFNGNYDKKITDIINKLKKINRAKINTVESFKFNDKKYKACYK